MSDRNPLRDATSAINAILAKLEADTETIVRRIDLDDVEITKMCDDRKRFARTVVIDLERLPGSQWST